MPNVNNIYRTKCLLEMHFLFFVFNMIFRNLITSSNYIQQGILGESLALLYDPQFCLISGFVLLIFRNITQGGSFVRNKQK